MCECRILHTDTSGYVAYCADCKHIQIAFDSVVLNVYKEEFEKLYSLAGTELKNHAEDIINKDRKYFMYNTNSRYVNLFYSYNDLERLHNLLAPARIILHASSLIGAA